jgi:lipoate-protein ligase A
VTHLGARVIHHDDAAAEGPRAAPSRGVLMEPAAWLDMELPGVAENLALDEALLEAAQDGVLTDPIVRTWMPTSPAVVMGASSRLSQEVDLEACDAAGAVVLRRPSGGLSVVLGPGCLMWSVIWPADDPAPVIDAIHASLLEPLALALRAAGRSVVRRGTSDLAMQIGSEERKVSGNALRVRRRARLYHGTLLDTLDLGLIERLLRHPPREPDYRAGRSHTAFVANLGLGRAALDAAVRTAFDVRRTQRDWPGARVEQLVRERYADPAWIGRLE